jgi:cbb3-type cytochrome oxidase subunit 3
MQVKILLLIILGLISISFSQSITDTLSSEIKLRTYIENEEVPLNREVVYHIELRWHGELNQYKISDVLEPTVSNLATRGSGSSNKVRTDPDGNLISVKEITYYFRPLEIGMAYIDGVTIRYTDQVKENEESLISSRIGVKIVEPLPEPSENGIMSTIFLGLLVLILIGGIVYLYLHYRKKKRESEEKALSEIIETVEEKYLRLLKETIHLNTDNVKDSLNDLTHLLNGYISERYHFQVSNLSVDDLVEALKNNDLSEESLSRIEDYYSKANLVKFAGESVEDSEFHRLYDTVELLLENQKIITEEDTDKNSKNSEDK